MNDKGQLGMMGMLLVVFVGIVVALALYGAILGNIGAVTQEGVENQSTITFGADGTTVNLVGQAVSDVVVINATRANQVLPASNYTILNNQVDNGVLTAQLQSDGGNFTGSDVNVSYNLEPDGYASDSSARSLTILIAIFAALAIAVWTLSPALQSLKDNGFSVGR